VFVWDIFKMSTEGLKDRKFRVTLNLLGILIGCTAVTGLVSMTQGLNDEVESQLNRFGPNNLMIIPGELTTGASFMGQSFTWRDLEIIRRVPGIDEVTPIIGNKIAEFQKKGETRFTYVFGVEAEYFEINEGWKVEKGRNIKRGETGVALLGADVAQPMDLDEPLFDVGDRITIFVNVGGEEDETTLRVVGIMEKMGGTFGSEDDASLFIPLRVCQQLYKMGGEFQYIAAHVKDRERIPEVIGQINEKMSDSVTVMSAESMGEMVGSILGVIEGVLGGVAAISLLVAGVGIVNTMTISVMERTREIGVMKALGAKSTDVLLMFLSEAVVTGLIGGTLGALLGFALGGFIGRYINLPVSNSVFLGIGVVAFAVLTSALSGLYPAWRAANLNPVEALRHE
jgi:putative ABC transport system permease protein